MSGFQRYFMELSYEGSAFHGWQIQHNSHTVQESIETALSTYFKSPISIMGSGRTDTGVHASMQVCHFDYSEDFDREKLLRGLNGILPKQIAIHSIRKVIPDAHARFDAKERSYVYRMLFRKNPFIDHLAWTSYARPDIDLMNQAASALLRHEDFESFSKVKTEVNNFRCQIKKAVWEQNGEEMLFHITANRFLRGMVRAIVGTLVEIGMGRRPVDDMDTIIDSRDRKKAGKSAPAQGLFLSKIVYPEKIYLD